MADIKSAEERSRNMAQIHNRNTKPEVWLRKQLFNRGYRYRTNTGIIPGHPDIWLAKYRTAVFINGCFWHRHPGCKYTYTPKSNVAFWQAKFESNIVRDAYVLKRLEEQKIKTAVIWECSVKKAIAHKDAENSLLAELENFFLNNDMRMEL